MKTELLFQVQQAKGIRLNFLEASSAVKQINNNQPMYGMKKIIVQRPGLALKLGSCVGKSTEITRFMVESVEEFDISTFVPGQIARQHYSAVYTSTYKLVRGYMATFEEIKITIKKARGITDQLAYIQTELENFFGMYRSYQKFFMVHIQKLATAEMEKCYGCDKEQFVESCVHLLRMDPKKASGYYYVKTPCMPEVKRVYCDMGEGQGNFYLFHGNLDTPSSLNVDKKDLGTVCEMYGLEPVKITGVEILKDVIKYLLQLKAVTLTNYGVSLFFRPDEALNTDDEEKRKYYDLQLKGYTEDLEDRQVMVKDFISADD